MADNDDFVPVTGVVHLRTSLGIFLAVDGLQSSSGQLYVATTLSKCLGPGNL